VNACVLYFRSLDMCLFKLTIYKSGQAVCEGKNYIINYLYSYLLPKYLLLTVGTKNMHVCVFFFSLV
jgi:hypothetical protein